MLWADRRLAPGQHGCFCCCQRILGLRVVKAPAAKRRPARMAIVLLLRLTAEAQRGEACSHLIMVACAGRRSPPENVPGIRSKRCLIARSCTGGCSSRVTCMKPLAVLMKWVGPLAATTAVSSESMWARLLRPRVINSATSQGQDEPPILVQNVRTCLLLGGPWSHGRWPFICAWMEARISEIF
jgi:hypothetical protein